MGPDAVERGLCDAAGTLLDAVADAATWAGLDPNDIVLEEFPPRKRFRLPRLLPGLPLAPWFLGRPASAAGESASDYGLQYLRAVAGSPGEPMLLAPPEALPASWAEDPAPGGTSP